MAWGKKKKKEEPVEPVEPAEEMPVIETGEEEDDLDIQMKALEAKKAELEKQKEEAEKAEEEDYVEIPKQAAQPKAEQQGILTALQQHEIRIQKLESVLFRSI